MNLIDATVTARSRIFDIFGVARQNRSHITDWTIVQQDEFGSIWEGSFSALDGMGDNDEFAQAIVRYAQWPLDFNSDVEAIVECLYIEASDTYTVRFGERTIPLSEFSWTRVEGLPR